MQATGQTPGAFPCGDDRIHTLAEFLIAGTTATFLSHEAHNYRLNAVYKSFGNAQAWSVCCSTSEGAEEDALVDEGAPHEVLIRQARSALAEGSASEETMVRTQLCVQDSARCPLLYTYESAVSLG